MQQILVSPGGPYSVLRALQSNRSLVRNFLLPRAFQKHCTVSFRKQLQGNKFHAQHGRRVVLPDQQLHHTAKITTAALPETKEQPATTDEVDTAKLPKQPKKLERFTTSATRDYRQALLNFEHKEAVKDGIVIIRPLRLEDLSAATDLLTQVFAATDDGFGLYTRYMRIQIRQYLTNHLRIAPDAVVLVATLHLTPKISGRSRVDSSSDSSSSSSSSRSSSSSSSSSSSTRSIDGPSDSYSSTEIDDSRNEGILMGTVEVAFTPATRTTFLTLNPPKDCAYLGNMCVDEPYRRRGYGKLLLKAGAQLTRLASFPAVFLHLRFKDVGAAALYEAEGYSEVKRDLWLLSLIGYSRRFLMKKDLSK